MLMTPMTPKVMARPMAASSRTEPSESPYQTFWTLSHIARLALDRADRVLRGALDAVGRAGRQARQQRQRLLVAALAHDADRFDLFGFAGVRLEQDDGGVRFDQRAPDGRDGLFLDRRDQRFQRIRHPWI